MLIFDVGNGGEEFVFRRLFTLSNSAHMSLICSGALVGEVFLDSLISKSWPSWKLVILDCTEKGLFWGTEKALMKKDDEVFF